MLAIFEHPIELFTVGELSMLVGDYYVNITVRVVRVESGDHGLAFQIDTETDRSSILILMEFLAASTMSASVAGPTAAVP